jgi:photosystem II stability/assembly factor-like uncharacterized protein
MTRYFRSFVCIGLAGMLLTLASAAGVGTPARAAGAGSAARIQVSTVSFATTKYGWASGSMGALLRTTDGGAHWKRQFVLEPSFVDQDSYRVEALSSSVCWAVGSGGIYKTTNAGKTWVRVAKKLRPSSYAGNAWEFCRFVGSSGWIVSSCGDIIGTKNAGKTWSRQRTAEDAGNDWVGGFSATKVGHAFVAVNAPGGHHVLATTDGGATWQQVGPRPFTETNDDLRGIWAENASRVWVATRGGSVYLSEDGGTSWRETNTGVGPSELTIDALGGYGTTVCAVGSRWATNTGAAVLSSSDGVAWGWVTFVPTVVSFVEWASEKTGWVVAGGGQIWRTVDGGGSWKRQR